MPRSQITKKRKHLVSQECISYSNFALFEEPLKKTIKFSGTVPVDEGFPDYANGPYHVYKEDDVVYDAMLNQTNIDKNNNKYYVIQIVKHNAKNEFIMLCRWGRVGKVAGKSSKTIKNIKKAKQDFAKKFCSKTGNNWWHLRECTFFKVPGKYDFVKVDYGSDTTKAKKKETKPLVTSQLSNQVQDLIRLIFNEDEWEASVKEMKFDVKKAPLGKLTKEQVKAGYISLKKIEKCLKQKRLDTNMLEEACSEFYTKIPHDFGMKKPPLIKTSDEIKEKVELLNALNDIQIAVTLKEKDTNGVDKNVLDLYYESLQCKIEPLEKKSHVFKMIDKYVYNSFNPSMSNCRKIIKIEDIFQIHRDVDEKRFKKEIGNRMLLWHGSRLTNWCGILSQGLRIAPPEAPVSGYSFGKGVYFADIFSNSFGFCHVNPQQPFGLLLVCDVALGEIKEYTRLNVNAGNLPKGKDSVKALGLEEPNPKYNQILSNGTVVPLGKPSKDSARNNSKLLHNEFIVYDMAQINPCYLVKVKFKY